MARSDGPDRSRSLGGSDQEERRGLGKLRPLPPPAGVEPLPLEDHRELVTRRREIAARLEEHPGFASLLLVNPAKALDDLGVELSKETRSHLLRALRHPPRAARRREELERRLEEKIGESPRPLDGEWVSELLFGELELQPLATRGHHPRYRPPPNREILERVTARRPSVRTTPEGERRLGGTRIRLAEWEPGVRHLDVDAELPDLEPADEPPKRVGLGTLFFYKEAHPLARDLLELGVLMEGGVGIRSAEAYRRIRDGKEPSAFRQWVSRVEFPEETE